MLRDKRTVDVFFGNEICRREHLDIIEQSSGAPHVVPMSIEGFVGDAREYLVGQVKKLAKKLRKYQTYTQCVISDVQTENDWAPGLKPTSCSLVATFYRNHRKRGFWNEKI